MARGINKVILIGNLGADPEMRYTASGTPMCTFRIATTEVWGDREGNQQERTEWHRIVAWGKLGEICGQYLAKGRQVYVEGSLRTRSWEDASGNRRWITEVVARDVQFLGGPAAAGGGGGSDYGPGGTAGPGGPPPPPDDDIPF